MTTQSSTRLKIARGTGPDQTLEVFDVPFTPGASVLDGLIWIRENLDETIAFRYACISANVCKECVIQIDGRKTYACTERLQAGEMTLLPLPSKTLVRDLACATVPPKERL